MGQLYDIIQKHMDKQGYKISKRQVAERLEVSPTTLTNWQRPTRLIDKEHLLAIARVTGVPYPRVLDALLEDIGYLREDGDGDADSAASIA